MIIRRKKLGTTYTKSPVDNLKAWLMINLGKIIFTIFISICYLGLLYVGIGVVRFLGTEVAGVFDKTNYTTADFYQGPYGLLLKVVGLIGIVLYVFKDAHHVKK